MAFKYYKKEVSSFLERPNKAGTASLTEVFPLIIADTVSIIGRFKPYFCSSSIAASKELRPSTTIPTFANVSSKEYPCPKRYPALWFLE